MRDAEQEEDARGVRVTRAGEPGQLRDRFVRLPRSEQQPCGIEARDAKLRFARHRLPIRRERPVEVSLTFECLSQIVVRRCVLWIDRDGEPIRRRRFLPSLLQAEQHAVVIVRVADITRGQQGPVVRLRLRPLLRAAVQRDEVRMGLSERRVGRERCFMGADRGSHVSSAGERDPAREPRAPVVAERSDGRHHRIVDSGPQRPVLRVALESTARLVPPVESAIGQSERVVRRPPLRE